VELQQKQLLEVAAPSRMEAPLSLLTRALTKLAMETSLFKILPLAGKWEAQ